MNMLRIKTLSDRMGGWIKYKDPYPPDGSGGGSTCQVRDCTTTYTGPMGVECCCFYDCPSGGLWKCIQGQYCPA